ncbi:MAG: uracil-DNA glycosylase [Planctomycetes bacterium]|nr:uracil-DNA glycosylase [Planctomycetota bacterium]
MDELELAAVQRAVVQRLEDFQRAGLSHWKRIQPVVPEPTPADAELSRRSAATASAPHAPPVHATPSLFTEPSVQVTSMPKRSTSAVPPSVAAVVPAAFTPLNLPRDERVTQLKVLQDKVKQCTRCQELASTRTQTVFGVGNPEARILFVGEAPGADEDKQGEPFVGRAGQLLNDIIKACRLKREDIYICNVLRCRPPGNRLPSPEEAGHCREYLDGQIAIVNPDYIVCWGSTAAKNLLASEAPIGKMRGKFFEYGRAKVVCTYHPSYLLRNPAAKKDVWEDMKFLFQDMGIDLSAKT